MTIWLPNSTPNFSLETDPRLACSHTGKCHMQNEHMVRLQMLRNMIGPVRINSGYRDPSHPEERGKVHPGSHAQGLATDIVPLKADMYRAVAAAFRCGFTGIGAGKTFLHLDSGHAHAPRPAFWTY